MAAARLITGASEDRYLIPLPMVTKRKLIRGEAVTFV